MEEPKEEQTNEQTNRQTNDRLVISSIVAIRDYQPYVVLEQGGKPVCQLTMGQARQVARDIEVCASRGEADAMMIKFMREHVFKDRVGAEKETSDMAIAVLLKEFRTFRGELDDEEFEHSHRVEVDE